MEYRGPELFGLLAHHHVVTIQRRNVHKSMLEAVTSFAMSNRLIDCLQVAAIIGLSSAGMFACKGDNGRDGGAPPDTLAKRYVCAALNRPEGDQYL